MVKHNNVIPNQHFKKDWQRYVKTWFNQPGLSWTRKILAAHTTCSLFVGWQNDVLCSVHRISKVRTCRTMSNVEVSKEQNKLLVCLVQSDVVLLSHMWPKLCWTRTMLNVEVSKEQNKLLVCLVQSDVVLLSHMWPKLCWTRTMLNVEVFRTQYKLFCLVICAAVFACALYATAHQQQTCHCHTLIYMFEFGPYFAVIFFCFCHLCLPTVSCNMLSLSVDGS